MEVVFRHITLGLLLVSVTGIAQAKQPGVIGPLRFRQRREKVQLRLMVFLEGVAGMQYLFHIANE